MPERFAQLEMLLRRERIIALRAELMMLDIAVLVLAVRHFGERQVRDRREHVVQFLLGSLLRRLPAPGSWSSARRPRPSALRRGLVLLLLRLRRSPSRPRCAAPAPARPSGSRRGALVERQQVLRLQPSSPRRLRPRSKASGFSRIHLMSCMASSARPDRGYGIRRVLIGAGEPISQRFAARNVCGFGRAASPFSVSPKGNGAPGGAPADRRPLANPNPGSAARHGRSPVTRGCRYRARWPSDVGSGASRRSNPVPLSGTASCFASDAAIDGARDRAGHCRYNSYRIECQLAAGAARGGETPVALLRRLGLGAGRRRWLWRALPSTIFTDQIEPS